MKLKFQAGNKTLWNFGNYDEIDCAPPPVTLKINTCLILNMCLFLTFFYPWGVTRLIYIVLPNNVKIPCPTWGSERILRFSFIVTSGSLTFSNSLFIGFKNIKSIFLSSPIHFDNFFLSPVYLYSPFLNNSQHDTICSISSSSTLFIY